MAKVVLDISLSLDGFVTAANPRPEAPLGDGGQRLHAWAFADDPRNRELLAEGVGGTGAVIAGRRTYEACRARWGADGPTGPARLPVIVLCHRAPAAASGGVYRFVTEGIESALEQARTAADGRDVTIMGGALTGRQYIRAGLVDELSLHVVPVLFGRGTRLFDDLGDRHTDLQPLTMLQTPDAAHQRLRIEHPTPPHTADVWDGRRALDR